MEQGNNKQIHREANGKRPATLRRQQQLLGVVYEVVAEKGIDGASMRDIAAAAGASTGTVNYHFGNKYDLIIAALEQAYKLPEDWESYRGSPLSQLQRLAMGYVFRSSRERFWHFWIDFTSHSSRDKNMRERQATRYQHQERFWTRLVQDAIDASEIRRDLIASEVAERLLLLVHGLLVRQILMPDAATRERARELLLAFFEELRP